MLRYVSPSAAHAGLPAVAHIHRARNVIFGRGNWGARRKTTRQLWEQAPTAARREAGMGFEPLTGAYKP